MSDQNTVLFGNYYSHRTIRKIVTVFGDMFNDITFGRYNQAGTIEVERMLVPLVWGSKEKWVSRILVDPNLTRSIQVSLPMLSYQLDGFAYDPSRKQQSLIKRYNVNTSISAAGTVNMQYIEVPYNFYFTVTLYARNIEDSCQILEQILPIFKPDYTTRVNFDPSMGIEKDMPVILESSSLETDDIGDAETMRLITMTLKFKVKGYVFGPETQSGVIQRINVNFYTTTQTNGIIVLVLQPGGFGTYKIGDLVYQGQSLQQSTAFGSIIDWDSLNDKLYVTVSDGLFTPGANVIGANTGAAWNLSSFYNSNGIPAAILSLTPNPAGANANSNYSISVQIKNFPDVP